MMSMIIKEGDRDQRRAPTSTTASAGDERQQAQPPGVGVEDEELKVEEGRRWMCEGWEEDR
jgi:hypothetical protein